MGKKRNYRRSKRAEQTRLRLEGKAPGAFTVEQLRAILKGVRYSHFDCSKNTVYKDGACFRLRIGMMMNQPIVAIIAHGQFVHSKIIEGLVASNTTPEVQAIMKQKLPVLDPKKGRRGGLSLHKYNRLAEFYLFNRLPTIRLSNNYVIETE